MSSVPSIESTRVTSRLVVAAPRSRFHVESAAVKRKLLIQTARRVPGLSSSPARKRSSARGFILFVWLVGLGNITGPPTPFLATAGYSFAGGIEGGFYTDTPRDSRAVRS